MSNLMATAEFDRIADVYDDTRRALDEETLDGMSGMLAKGNCHSVLEIAVGTGRVSTPLIKRGYEITGVDISRRMMEKARGKGMANLLLADGGSIPFKDKTFDATLMAHVFHLLEDPFPLMREGARVSRVGVFVLLRKGGFRPWFGLWGGGNAPAEAIRGNTDQGEVAKFVEERRTRFRKLAEKYHWDWNSGRGPRHWGKEEEILKSHPPDELKVVSDVVMNNSLEERIARIEKGGYGFFSEMPVEMKREIIKNMRDEGPTLPDWARQPSHEVNQVAMWKSETLLRIHAPKS